MSKSYADQLLAAPTITGENVAQVDTAEPTVREAAELIRASGGLGTVARLDYVHAALCAAYARGRAIATAEADAQPWVLQ